MIWQNSATASLGKETEERCLHDQLIGIAGVEFLLQLAVVSVHRADAHTHFFGGRLVRQPSGQPVQDGLVPAREPEDARPRPQPGLLIPPLCDHAAIAGRTAVRPYDVTLSRGARLCAPASRQHQPGVV